jgi:alpha-D-glucose phosphate-specific phosphoglucomutase
MIKFGTDGWRAVISDEFTFENVRKVTQAIAGYLNSQNTKDKPVIIGYDARFLADKFAEAAAKVLSENGFHCLLPERDTPTPVIAWEVKDRGAAGALMFTASHNPPQYCGIKFIPHYAGPANEEITKQIEENLTPSLRSSPLHQRWRGVSEERGRGEVERFEPRERYTRYIEKFIDVNALRSSQLKIVVDPMFGSGRDYLDHILQKFGISSEEIHGQRDVLFGGHNPEPEAETLSELRQKVIEQKADLGLALDGDADRFGVVDEAGDFYSANQVISMVFEYLVKEKGLTGSVVRSLATTHMLDAIAKKNNIQVHETPVGFKHIAKVMMQEDVIIGGEESGGFSIKSHIPEKDGLLADLLVAEMVAKKKKPLSRIWEDLTKTYGAFEGRRGKVKVEEGKKQKIMDSLKKPPFTSIHGQKIAKILSSDGVKIILEDGSWFLVRASGTEPLMRIYAESLDRGILDEIENFCYNLLGGRT